MCVAAAVLARTTPATMDQGPARLHRLLREERDPVGLHGGPVGDDGGAAHVATAGEHRYRIMAAISSTVPSRMVVPSETSSSVNPASVRPTVASSDSTMPGVDKIPERRH